MGISVGFASAMAWILFLLLLRHVLVVFFAGDRQARDLHLLREPVVKCFDRGATRVLRIVERLANREVGRVVKFGVARKRVHVGDALA